MARTALDSDPAQRLGESLESVPSEIAQKLASMLDRAVECGPGSLRTGSGSELLAELPQPTVVITCGTGDAERGSVRFAMDAATAAVLAACVMMNTDEAIADKRASGSATAEDLESLADIAAALCSCLGAVLATHLDGAEIVPGDRSFLDPGDAGSSWPGTGTLAWFRFPIAIAGGPESTMHLVLDRSVAEVCNGGPVSGDGEDAVEEIPAAPIRGRMAAFLVDQGVFDLVRKSCRRVGLEIDRFPATAIPNPAAHRGQIVLMDVSAGEDQRFAWCRRLIERSPDITVALVLHHPSRARVVQAFCAKARIILGWPMPEALLSQKLAAVLDAGVDPVAD